MPNFCLLIPLVHCLRNTPTHPTSIHYSSWYTASEIHPHTQLPFTTLLSTIPLVHCLRNTPTHPTSIHYSSWLPQKYTHTPNIASEIYPHIPFTTPPSTLLQEYTHIPNFCLLILIVHCLRNTPTHTTSIHYSS